MPTLIALQVLLLGAILWLWPARDGPSLAQRLARSQAAAVSPARGLVRLLPGRSLARFLPATYQEALAGRLLQARLHERLSVADLVALKLWAGIIPAAWFVLVGLASGQPAALAYAAVLGLGGLALPDIWLKRQISGRRLRLQRELPHVLSTFSLCLGAGLSLASSLEELCRIHRTGVLAEEVRIAAEQVRAGTPAAGALQALAARLEVPELRQVVGVLVQHLERGSETVAAVMAAEAEQAWLRRRRRAEALAQTAGLKLFLPQLVFNLPALLLILLGPGALMLWQFLR